MKKILLLAIVTISLGFLVYARAGTGVTFVVRNVGAEPLRSVVVHVTGKSYPVGDIAAGASTSVKVNPTSESHVELEFAGHPRLVVDCYIEKGYRGSIAADVTSERVVTVKDSAKSGY